MSTPAAIGWARDETDADRSRDDVAAKAELISLFEDAGFFTIDPGALITGATMQQLGAPLAGVNLIRRS